MKIYEREYNNSISNMQSIIKKEENNEICALPFSF